MLVMLYMMTKFFLLTVDSCVVPHVQQLAYQDYAGGNIREAPSYNTVQYIAVRLYACSKRTVTEISTQRTELISFLSRDITAANRPASTGSRTQVIIPKQFHMQPMPAYRGISQNYAHMRNS